MTGEEVLLIVGMALVTFLVRYPALALVGRLPLPDAVFRALRYVPPAVLAAIIIPAITLDGRGALSLNAENAYLLAGVITFVTAWLSRNTLLTIVIGMAALLVLKQFLAG
mgnify:CR=1 FL=1|jgi:branched-subunit amino acid transport protein